MRYYYFYFDSETAGVKEVRYNLIEVQITG